MKYPCIETTYDINFDDIEIRLWINREEIGLEDESTPSFSQVENFLLFNLDMPKENLVEAIRDLVPNLNAVQFKEKVGNGWKGTVVYLVDFENHG